MTWFERFIVQRFVLVMTIAALALVACLVLALSIRSVTLDQVSKMTDTLLKALAILVGALWSLNRYFTARTDYPQLRVEAITDAVPSTLFGKDAVFGLLSYRLDIINTSKALLPVTGYQVTVENVLLRDDRIMYEELYRWPKEGGMHPATSIEPGSWFGISDAIPCPSDVRAVKIFLDVALEKEGHWTWHRILTVPPRANGEGVSASDAKAHG